MKRFLLLSFISAALLTLALVGLEHAMIMSRAGEGIGMKLAARAPASTQHRTGSFGGVAGRSHGFNTSMLTSKEAIDIRKGALGYNSPWNRRSIVDHRAGHSSPFVNDRISRHRGQNHSVYHLQSKNNTLGSQEHSLWWSEYSKLPSLLQRDIDGVEKFVFFVGYPRSGHSIIGSMMDAHPNMIVSHQFLLFKKMTEDSFTARLLQNKTVLFNALYQKSYRDAKNGWRSPNNTVKGYTLYVGTPWQATFHGSLKVIGDKSGGQTVIAYGRDMFRFEKAFSSIRDTVQIPIRVIHVVRNPYDMIATWSLYACRPEDGRHNVHRMYVEGQVSESSLKTTYKDCISEKMRPYTRDLIKAAQDAHAMIHKFNLTVLEIHAADFAKDPRKTISRICTFLDLPCPEDYLQACYDKAYKTESKSRHLVAWPEDVQADVDAAVRSIPFFKRYSFDGD